MASMSREEVNMALAEAIAADPGLRERLIADPRAVLGTITGLDIPEFINVTVHEESLTDIHLVLSAPTSDLTEEDLQLVAGGWNPGPPSMCGTSCGACRV